MISEISKSLFSFLSMRGEKKAFIYLEKGHVLYNAFKKLMLTFSKKFEPARKRHRGTKVSSNHKDKDDNAILKLIPKK